MANDHTFFIIVGDGKSETKYKPKIHFITVESSLNLPSVAEVTLIDEFKDGILEFTDNDLFMPGKRLRIYANESQKLFDGEIVELEPYFEHPNKYCLIRAFDRLHKLMRGQFTRVFNGDTDGDIATKIIQEITPLIPKVQSTSPKHEYTLQANETKLAFLQRRARAIGYVIYADGDEIHFESPQSRKTIEMALGKDGLSVFRPRLSVLNQPTEVTVKVFDEATQKTVTGTAKVGVGQPEIGESKDRVTVVKGGSGAVAAPQVVAHVINDTSDSIKQQVDKRAEAEANRRSSEYIQAEGTCGGNWEVMAGTTIQISSVGKRFAGKYLVSSVTHTYGDKNEYSTNFSVTGMHVQTIQNLLNQESTPRHGLTIGVVEQIEDSAKNKGKNICRVKVRYPGIDETVTSHWARVVSVGGGPNRGIEFLPEVHDEVLIGFENGDPHLPYVLGGLWSESLLPPERTETIVEENKGKVKRRLIRSRTGHTITLDDSDSSLGITVDDGKGGKIHIDTKNKTMTLEAPEGIEIKSKKITINGSEITVNGSQSVSIDGKQIEIGKP